MRRAIHAQQEQQALRQQTASCGLFRATGLQTVQCPASHLQLMLNQSHQLAVRL
ncbi:MAG: hypothetical protein U0R19_07390 [Bryobacteraceae bacterium]